MRTHIFASAQQRSHNLRENNVVQTVRLTLPEQLLKYVESFIKAPASGRRSQYTAGRNAASAFQADTPISRYEEAHESQS